MKPLPERVNKLTLDPAVSNMLHDMDAAREARKMQKRERDAARRKQSRDEARKKREAERQAARAIALGENKTQILSHIKLLPDYRQDEK